jgi:hypothetical protein
MLRCFFFQSAAFYVCFLQKNAAAFCFEFFILHCLCTVRKKGTDGVFYTVVALQCIVQCALKCAHRKHRTISSKNRKGRDFHINSSADLHCYTENFQPESRPDSYRKFFVRLKTKKCKAAFIRKTEMQSELFHSKFVCITFCLHHKVCQ